ncbi:Snakin-2 [Zea mays]|uniref:Snakin-2 n=2 Tax=Zea mays TaxID=4577 RepID=A0A1D6GX78_MAIZE|nr:Snakin-2 [Zea mays]
MCMCSAATLPCCHVGRHGHQLHCTAPPHSYIVYCCCAHSLYICITACFWNQERRSPLHSRRHPPLPLLFLEMTMTTMKKQQQLLLLLSLMFLVAVTAAAVAADPHPQQVQVQVQQQQQAQMRINRATRSLLPQPPPKLDCPSTCSVRCGNNWKNQMCNKMCNVCCNKCSCVPPGTGQDTRHLCPCYDTMLNPHTGKLKCP